MTVPARATPTLAFHRFSVHLLLLLALLLAAPSALADGRVSFLAARLKYPPGAGQADDFRVRTNAALALGTTDSDDAIPPLCGALDDPSEVVRQAVAVALKRLSRQSSHDCLQRRADTETNASVKAQIKRALDALDAAGGSSRGAAGGGEAPSAANAAKYYVSVSKITNNTTRSAADVQRIVGGAISSKLAELGEYQMAPSG
ncbi:MAG TPA: HEAT repeat domain-containing protein, partial [Polyangiaceae bacterium]|nr:HEAT repeat domain-containing protein [Polyangiaceae bacterium]